jgi:hypothetical protein
MDTRYWGPSGWDLFHRISIHSTNPDEVLKNLAEILPCKFCRNSTRRFIKELPYNSANPAEWLYEIHNKVNHKLQTQHSKDSKVIDPGPNPSFQKVYKKYARKSLNKVLGRKFLLSVAVNFVPNPRKIETQKRFLKNLALAYPKFNEFLINNPPDFSNYCAWMQKFTKGSIEETESFKSKCKKGKTCRKTRGGGRRLTQRLL